MALKEVLRGLCCKTGWCYAVFWKRKRRSRMVLTWEDSYFEQGAGDNKAGDNPLDLGNSHRDVSYLQGRIELAVAKMSYCVHFMGEGIIGRVAFTGKHKWVFADGNINEGASVGEHPVRWDAQFAAGIKTISIIAVSQGVVQLGSTQVIVENRDWVNHVKSAFGTLQNFSEAFPPEGMYGKALARQTAVTQPLDGKLAMESGSITLHSLDSEAPGSLVHSSSDMQGYRKDWENQAMRALGSAWDDAKSSKSNVLQTISESCMDVTRLGTWPLSNQFECQRNDSNSYLLSKAEISNAMDLEVQLDSMNCSEHTYNEEGEMASLTKLLGINKDRGQDVHAECEDGHVHPQLAMASLTKLLGINKDRGQEVHAGCEDGQVQPQLAQLNGLAPSVQSSGLALVAPFLMQENSPMVKNAVGLQDLPSAYCDDGQGGSVSWCESLQASCHNVWDSEKCKIGTNRKSVCTVLDFNGVVVGSRMDELDKYLASLSGDVGGKGNFNFAVGDELSRIMGPAFQQGKDKNLVGQMQPLLRRDQTVGQPQVIMSELSNWALERCCLEAKSDALLEAVVAKSSASSSNGSYCFNNMASVLNSTKEAANSRLVDAHVSHVSLPESFRQTALDCRPFATTQTLNTAKYQRQLDGSNSSFTENISIFAKEIQSMRSDSTQTSQSQKSEELSKAASRKRARPGESGRPRPKDRQQIQDRVRELREIVPNGSKCSIDTLLEKTIKHMLFLQSVMLHADKLKVGEFKEDMENGASWAVDVGGGEVGCPILVKNLSQPRQMLVEMFYEENGQFLEISDVIRSLGLTILKGVMEFRIDKIWARFIVEANQDVHRVDLMMALMQLLNINGRSSSSSSVMTMASHQTL